MPLSAPSRPTNPSATLRQLKVLVAVLILSNIGLGVFSFYLLRAIDRQYSSLLGQSANVLNDLQTQTAVAVDAMRWTNPAAVAAGGRAAAISRGRAAWERDRQLREALLAGKWLTPEPRDRIEFKAAGDVFTREADRILTLLAGDKLAEAEGRREQELRPAFERYLAAATRAADVQFAETMRLNGELTARTGSLSTILLGLGSWPVAVLMALLLFMAVFVAVLMFFFRGREMGDMP